jgi:hypothetical protein
MGKYTDKQKAEALELYMEHGPGEASRRTKIPRATISGWARDAGKVRDRETRTAAATKAAQESFAARRARLKDELLGKVLDLLNRMDQEHVDFKGQFAARVTYEKPPADAVRNYATSVGILIDKMRLELGEATSRDESVSDLDREIERLLGQMAPPDEAHVHANGNGRRASA